MVLRYLRLFVAVNFSDRTKNRIESLINQLKIIPADAKWVSRDNLHITLKFLGNVPEDQVPALVFALKGAAEGIAPIKLELGGFGLFPGSSRPRVFWLGSAGQLAMLSQLHDHVQTALERIGMKVEKKRFTPHLTLARLRSPARIDEIMEEAAQLTANDRILASETIKSFELMSSILGQKGPTYAIMTKIQLKNNN